MLYLRTLRKLIKALHFLLHLLLEKINLKFACSCRYYWWVSKEWKGAWGCIFCTWSWFDWAIFTRSSLEVLSPILQEKSKCHIEKWESFHCCYSKFDFWNSTAELLLLHCIIKCLVLFMHFHIYAFINWLQVHGSWFLWSMSNISCCLCIFVNWLLFCKSLSNVYVILLTVYLVEVEHDAVLNLANINNFQKTWHRTWNYIQNIKRITNWWVL